MTHQQEIRDKNVTSEDSREHSFINNPKHPLSERIALVRSMTDRLQLSLDDIRNSVESERLNSLSIIPPDLLPFEVNLIDGQKVTILETNPVVTCYDGELTNLEGNVIHVYLEKEELPKDIIPPKKMFTVTAQTLENVLPSIINELIIPRAKESKCLTFPGTSKKMETPSNTLSRDLSCTNTKRKEEDSSVVFASQSSDISSEIVKTCEDISNISCQITSNTAPSVLDHNAVIEVYTQPEIENVSQTEHQDTKCKQLSKLTENNVEQNNYIKGNNSLFFSSKFQVIGLVDVDTGTFRESGSEEGLNNINVGCDNKDWIQQNESTTIMVDKELGNPSDFTSVSFKTPSPVTNKKTSHLRKSCRIRKPKVRSSFKSWDDVQIRHPRPRPSRKGKSKGTLAKTRRIKKKVKLTKKKKM